MKKRVLTILLTLVLLLGLSVPVFAESQLWHITDDAGILTAEEDSQLEQYAEAVSWAYDVGIYIVTVDDYTDYYDDVYETAWQIYHGYTLGMEDDRDGVILLMSMDNRKFATFFYGPKAEYAFDAYGQEQLEDYFLDDFKNDDWSGGFTHFIDGCNEYLELAASGYPVRESPWGALVVIIGISCLLALVVCLILKGRLKSVRKGTEASDYVAGSLNLKNSRDQYTHTTETRTKIETESSSSSGGSHAESGGGGSGRSGSF